MRKVHSGGIDCKTLEHEEVGKIHFLSWWNTHFFYRQLDFPSEPGVANEILENEANSCLAVA